MLSFYYALIVQGTDLTMLQKLNTHHKRTKLFISPVNTASSVFGIRHFAGTVFYSSRGTTMIVVSALKY